MVKGEVTNQLKDKQSDVTESVIYSVEDIAKITNLFSILIKIDQKVKAQGGVTNSVQK